MTKKKLTAKRRVLKRYPNAYSAWSSLYGEWRVYNQIGGRVIGLGGRASCAWADAAGSVRRYGA